jgi:hypothetical protein
MSRKASERDRANFEAGKITDDKLQEIWELKNNALPA